LPAAVESALLRQLRYADRYPDLCQQVIDESVAHQAYRHRLAADQAEAAHRMAQLRLEAELGERTPDWLVAILIVSGVVVGALGGSVIALVAR